MRELDLDQKTLTYDDEPFKMLDEKQEPCDLTLGRAIMQQVYKTVSAEKDAQFATFELGLKVRKATKRAESTVLLETAEYDHLKTIMEKNPHGFIDIIQAQLQRMVEAVPEVKVEKKIEE